MTHFHAVMVDETGCEFGVSVTAASREAAFDNLRENYPESHVAQLESPEDRDNRKYDDYIAAMDDGPCEYLECDQCGAEVMGGSLCDDCADELD